MSTTTTATNASVSVRAADGVARRASVQFRMLRRSPLMTVGLTVVGLVVLIAVLAPFMGTRGPITLNLAFPLILLALAIAAILGPSLQNLILVMALTTWMIYARVVRGVTLSIREREFVQAARAIGVTDVGIMWRHILPNLMAPIMVI